MFIKSKDIVNMPVDKIQGMFEKLTRVNNNKIFSKQEEHEFKEQIFSFMDALKKCGNGHLISSEMKPVVKEFEKANFDFSKLPMSLRNSFDNTYKDLKTIENNTNEFKNTPISLYCKIYEFFSNKGNLQFIEKFRKDPIVKKNGYSTETLTDLDSIEMWMQDDRSIEMNLGFITTTLFGKTVAGTVSISNGLIAILVIISIVLIAIVSALIIINLKYKSELTTILKDLSDDKVKTIGKDNIRKEAVYKAAKQMNEKTSPLTKNTYYKPMNFAVSTLEKITSQGYNQFEKFTSKFNSAKNSKEDYQYSEEFLAGGGLAIPIIVCVILLIIMIKPIVYYIYNLKMRISVFFEEEATLLEINIEDLMEMRNNAPTEKEKERIGKIIEKQRKAMINMSSLSNFFYKQTNDAALKARDDIRDNDSQDYGAQVDEADGTNVPAPEDEPVEGNTSVNPDTPYETPQPDVPTTGTSVVLF